ncbi:uncharacterized protein LOC108481613 [Gossypium arboreum]|uniref:uncharacterized protein LOC108481613 n=1 Tax=Gossypium arboreum TaxID=29729 RepID=UPI0008194D16|nr:uncharacterized protein LOC108481613 [Gossypium arboreum]
MYKNSNPTEQALKASTHFSRKRGKCRGRGMRRGSGRDRGGRWNKDSGKHAKPANKGKQRDQQFDKSKKKEEAKTLLMAIHDKHEELQNSCLCEKGDISIRTKNGSVETISNVFFMSALKSNLLSVGQLKEKGYAITISKNACEIYNHSRGAIAVVSMSSNRLFPLVIDYVQPYLMVKVMDDTWLWHFRYGHLNFWGLKTFRQKEMVRGLP